MFYTHIWFVWQFASKNCRVISTNKYTHVYAYFIFCKSIPFFSCCQFSTIMIVTTSLNLKHEVFLSVWCLCRFQISVTRTIKRNALGSLHCRCTKVHFASFLSGRFITVIVLNPPKKKLAKRTSVQWCRIWGEGGPDGH